MAAELKEVPAIEALPAIEPKIKFVDVKLPQGEDLPNQFTFNLLDYVSPDDGRTYSGKFRVRRLSIGAMGQVGAVEAQLNGGMQVDVTTGWLHAQLAYLRVAILEAPAWWNPDNLYDLELISAIHKHARHWENSFRRQSVG